MTDDTPPLMGRRPENTRERLTKVSWMLIWMLYLVQVIADLVSRPMSGWEQALGWVGLVVFVGAYIALVMYGPDQRRRAVAYPLIGAMLASAVATSLVLGEHWLPLFIYVSVCFGAALRPPYSVLGNLGCAGLVIVCGLLNGSDTGTITALTITAALSGLAMIGLRRLIETNRELQAARATIASMAATEERLRLARDLHDLLGHSLSLITLKSELAGRLLPDRPEAAAGQVADIEKVSRQALVDVREAVSGYRRATVDGELASAKDAMRSAGIIATVAPELDRLAADGHPRLAPDRAGALAWALREAATNAVRHSGAARCTLGIEAWDDRIAVVVTDDGEGAPSDAASPGNGLRGLEERLLLVDGTLETGPGPRGRGFRLRASVPLLPELPEPAEGRADEADVPG
ncbi:hypothetical protein BIV57_11405 [Mangrovactinospora gilvigrisea]|uniref:Sensor histidine kinase n=1 Tax=Mangrovactinospora gilvigrisea TaxID=1428644 RepID=A0A1J7BF62_9ACTN|nr:sensor histidine kinase [Mangrovactinospora gilvigrisea]OIV37343.1 hypothetical protein BIV57_11405 [Mangrovactinospora gilvigrisea]